MRYLLFLSVQVLLVEPALGESLDFPSDREVGTVQFRESATRSKYADYSEPWGASTIAKGQIEIPAGHEVKLWVSASGADDLSFLSSLDPNALFSLDLWRSRVEDSQARHIAHATGLQELIIRDTKLTSVGLSQLSALRDLRILHCSAYRPNRELEFQNDNASDDPFAPSKDRDRGVWEYGFDDTSLQVISQMPELLSLQLRSNPISYKSLLHIGRLKKLQFLALREMEIADRGLELLRNLEQLEYLSFGVYEDGAPITDIGASKIAFIPNLKTLELNGSKITVDGLRHLSRMPKLESLNVENVDVAPSDLSVLAESKSLKRLRADWDHRDWRDYGSELAKIKSLEDIGQNLRVDRESLQAILTLPNLKALSVYGDQGEPFAGMGKEIAKCTQLESLDFQNISITDDDLLALQPLQQLQDLGLMRTEIRGTGLAVLAAFPKLETLSIYDGSRTASSSTVIDLNLLPQLSDGLRHIGLECAGLPKQRDFFSKFQSIRGTQIWSLVTDEHLAGMEALSNLESLSLEEPALSDEGLKSLLSMPNLEYASLGGALTLDGLTQLKELPRLNSVWVSSPYFGEEQIESLEHRLGSTSINVQGGDRCLFPGRQDGILRASSERRLEQDALEGSPAPAIQASKWYPESLEPFDLRAARGKLVLLFYWRTGRQSVVAQERLLSGLQTSYGERLQIIGLIAHRYAENADQFMTDRNSDWPTAIDDGGLAKQLISGSYHLIDRQGILRVVNAAEVDLKRAIDVLLTENP